MISEKDDHAKFLAEYRRSLCLFYKKFQFLAELATRCLVIEHRVAYSTKNFATSFFSDVMKVRNAGLPMVRIKRIKSIWPE